ncbi:MerR family transcriptional regulator [Nocardia canadensis]|uniref:MerR family transcriptional regulator n=1 Tax=Nocardia canadensis TaxID=3065238 RepID=UPI00292DE0ED|nr:MerR family transcriptional regulator [Nocardia canadensis]
MDDDTLFTIGDVAARTGLTVKAIRFYADRGIVAPTTLNPAGHRRYDTAALARLELVRTLRALGIDLATVRRVLAREASMTEVAATHVDALDVEIRALRVRRAVLRAVAAREPTPPEMDLMHRLATLSAAERHRLIEDFVDDTFGRYAANPAMVELVRAAVPELPDDPSPDQLAAWMELAELVRDTDFRDAVRRMAAYQARERAAGDTTGLHHELTEAVRTEVAAAVDAGVAADSPAARPVLDALTARYASTFERPDDPALRRWILERLAVANDPRVHRYWRLLAVVNGWPEQPDLTPVFTWFAQALRAATA